MTIATTPTNALTGSPRAARVAEARWQEWRGLVDLYLRAKLLVAPATMLTVMQREHAEWLASLLSRGIPMRAIRRLALDDPRESRAALEAKVQQYTERQRRRLQ